MLTAEQLDTLARCGRLEAERAAATALGLAPEVLLAVEELRTTAAIAEQLAAAMRENRVGIIGCDTVAIDAGGYIAGAQWGPDGDVIECGGDSPYAAACDALASAMPSIDPTAGV